MDKKQRTTLDIVAITQRIDAARRLLEYGKSEGCVLECHKREQTATIMDHPTC